MKYCLKEKKRLIIISLSRISLSTFFYSCFWEAVEKWLKEKNSLTSQKRFVHHFQESSTGPTQGMNLEI